MRLPRLINPSEALAIVSSGKPIDAASALCIGLIDDIAGGDATQTAIALARQVADQPLPLTQNSPRPIANLDAWGSAKASILTKAGGALAPHFFTERSAAKLPA